MVLKGCASATQVSHGSLCSKQTEHTKPIQLFTLAVAIIVVRGQCLHLPYVDPAKSWLLNGFPALNLTLSSCLQIWLCSEVLCQPPLHSSLPLDHSVAREAGGWLPHLQADPAGSCGLHSHPTVSHTALLHPMSCAMELNLSSQRYLVSLGSSVTPH